VACTHGDSIREAAAAGRAPRRPPPPSPPPVARGGGAGRRWSIVRRQQELAQLARAAALEREKAEGRVERQRLRSQVGGC
jgi:hypothetical protein